MTIDKVHSFLDFIVDKKMQVWFAPPEKDDMIDRAQMEWFMQLYGNPREYQAGRYVPNIAYGISQRVNDSLAPFKKNSSFTTDSSGVITLPNDYLHLLSLNTNEVNADAGRVVLRPVQIINEDELIERLESQVCPVSLTDPIGIINGGKKIQLFPSQSQVGKIYYLRRPVVPVFGYTQVGRVITYNPGTSTQLEWDEVNINQIMIKALSYLGINLGANELIAMMSEKDKTGV